MMNSIGLIECKSIAKGIETADEMIKSSDVKLILATPMCPGKYIILIGGNVSSVKNAIKVGREKSGIFLISDHVIPNVHEDIFPALTATSNIKKISALGIIETMSTISSVVAGDTALKASNIQLIEIRLARGLGGKGFVIITGDVASVKSAVKSCENKLKDTGEIISSVVIPSPTDEVIAKLF